MLESLTSEKIYVKNLTLEDPTIASPANSLDNLISQKDWLKIEEELSMLIRTNEPRFLTSAAAINILQPDRMDEELFFNEGVFLRAQSCIEEYGNHAGWFMYLSKVAEAKTLFPKDLIFTTEEWELLYKQSKDDLSNREALMTWLDAQKNLKILDPEYWNLRASISAKEYIDQNKEVEKIISSYDQIGSYISTMCDLRYLFPEQFRGIKSGHPALKYSKGSLEHWREKNEWWMFAHSASHGKILTAEDVQITGSGIIKIKMPPSEVNLNQEQLIVPERRRF